MNTVVLAILAFIAAIALLVAVHEWGHYIAARLCGVRVIKFSVGFGRSLWSIRAGKDQTEYCVAAIPLGGYVRLLDEREGPVDPAERHRSFNRQPIPARIAILVAGPAMNFVFAVFAFWLMFLAGIPGLVPLVGGVEPDSIAGQAGIREGDRIIAVNDEPVATWDGTVLALFDALLENPRVRLELRREDGGARRATLNLGGRVGELTEPGNLLSGIGLTVYTPKLRPVIDQVSPGEAADIAGLRPRDEVVAADGEAIDDWRTWVDYVRARPGERVLTTVLRGAETLVLPLDVGRRAEADGSETGFIGAGVYVPDDLYAGLEAEQRYSGLYAVSRAVDRTWEMSQLTVRMVWRMLTGDVSVKNISGPINIAQYAGYSASVGPAYFLRFLAIVSLSLGILNLLPVPILDGGQVVYQLAEAVKGRPLSERAQLLGQQIGIAFLVLVMGFAFYNDLTRVF